MALEEHTPDGADSGVPQYLEREDCTPQHAGMPQDPLPEDCLPDNLADTPDEDFAPATAIHYNTVHEVVVLAIVPDRRHDAGHEKVGLPTEVVSFVPEEYPQHEDYVPVPSFVPKCDAWCKDFVAVAVEDAAG